MTLCLINSEADFNLVFNLYKNFNVDLMYLFWFRTFSAYAWTAVTLLTATLLCVPLFNAPPLANA
jgi:hypothetical protein